MVRDGAAHQALHNCRPHIAITALCACIVR